MGEMTVSKTIDEQFIEYIVKSLVGKPDSVSIVRTIDEKGVLLELTVDPEDLGRVIGKRGATAQSLRTLLRALGTKNDARYNLKIIDNGPEKPHRERTEDYHHKSDSNNNDSWSSSENDAGNVSIDPSTENSDNSGLDGWSSTPASSNKTASEDMDNEGTLEVDHGSVAAKTRRELEDLDDLDV